MSNGSRSPGLLLAESRVLTAVADGAILQGPPDDLMRRLDVSPRVFRVALHDLVMGGWIFATTAAGGRLTIGRERRAHQAGPPASLERRRPASLWEGLGAPLDA